jgi:peptidoglycan hydrolase-like protein with peptidoglycan-binding domain
MPRRRKVSSRAEDEDEAPAARRSRWLPGVRTRLGLGMGEVLALMAAGGGAFAIVVNALFMQTGPHPAPFFKWSALPSNTPTDTTATTAVAMPRPRPSDQPAAPPKMELQAISRTPGETLAEIQRELTRRGFYDGPIDGMHGPRTDASIRDFEQAAGLKPGAQQGEALLQAIIKSGVEVAKTLRPPAPIPPHNDAIADLLTPTKRVIAMQRALTQFGYGQIKPTGVVDAETRTAIEKFEREHKLPVTGQPSDRLAHELATATGRSID